MFYHDIAKIYNTNQSRGIILCGNVQDLFWNKKEFVPLIPFLITKIDALVPVVYELNGPIRIKEEHKVALKDAWLTWKLGESPNDVLIREMNSKKPSKVKALSEEFDANIIEAIGNPTLALEFMRQLTICSRSNKKQNLVIIIEAADMLLPAGNGDVANLNDVQLRRIAVVQDWLSDPSFLDANDMVILIAESRSLVHPRVSRLPQVLSVDVPSPDKDARKAYLEFVGKADDSLAELTAGLSIHALRQLVKSCGEEKPSREAVIKKVEEFIKSQLGEDMVEFKKPTHCLDDCVGFSALKKFLREELILRMQLKGDGCLSGAAVAGPIGGGKTFIFEAVASELNMPVLVLKNIRSQWYGGTDVILERLLRVLMALDRVLIVMDEADTQLGGVGGDVHETERRLTGKIQAMMSDPALKGKVYWLLMTARIHMLSPDIRRPGRVGDLIIPVLDPIGDDRVEFLKWCVKGINVPITLDVNGPWRTVDEIAFTLEKTFPEDYSAASFASLRNNLKYKKTFDSMDHLIREVNDFIQPAIKLTRRYQSLQALANCTRRSLLPPGTTDEEREGWETEINMLEARGIK